MTSMKGHNFIINLQNFTCNNPNLDLANINAKAKFRQIPLIRSKGIEQKHNFGVHLGP